MGFEMVKLRLKLDLPEKIFWFRARITDMIMQYFLFKDGDTDNLDIGAVGLMEDLAFTPVATSENVLFEADKIRIRDCGMLHFGGSLVRLL